MLNALEKKTFSMGIWALQFISYTLEETEHFKCFLKRASDYYTFKTIERKQKLRPHLFENYYSIHIPPHTHAEKERERDIAKLFQHNLSNLQCNTRDTQCDTMNAMKSLNVLCVFISLFSTPNRACKECECVVGVHYAFIEIKYGTWDVHISTVALAWQLKHMYQLILSKIFV